MKDINQTKLITFSITALFLFFLLSLLIIPLHFNKNKKILGQTIYLKDDFKNKDPFLTTAPNLDKIINDPIITADDPQTGAMDAKINITVFNNFTSSSCYELKKIITKIQQVNPEQIKIIHKDFPINNIKDTSFQAALAGRCAQTQDKFWEYSELLYKNNDLNRDEFIKLAQNVNLNIKKFTQCLDNYEKIELINNNLQEAYALKITGIPYLFINKTPVSSQPSYEELIQIIEKELDK